MVAKKGLCAAVSSSINYVRPRRHLACVSIVTFASRRNRRGYSVLNRCYHAFADQPGIISASL